MSCLVKIYGTHSKIPMGGTESEMEILSECLCRWHLSFRINWCCLTVPHNWLHDDFASLSALHSAHPSSVWVNTKHNRFAWGWTCQIWTRDTKEGTSSVQCRGWIIPCFFCWMKQTSLPMAIPRFGTHSSLRVGSNIARRRFLLKVII